MIFEQGKLSDFAVQSIQQIIVNAINEDIGEGDHSSLATIPHEAKGKAKLIVKDVGIIAGIDLAQMIFIHVDPQLKINMFLKDGDNVKPGDIAFEVEGKSQSILAAERLVLNFMQRMSGIATKTFHLTALIKDYSTKLLDTRKTTPGIRVLEKWAVVIGGGHNHRFALYDMIMIKDNHVDYAGGIEKAILSANNYLKKINKKLKIEIEVRNLNELQQVLQCGNVDRIMLDNFSPDQITEALKIIDRNKFETEASGKINESNILAYAKTGIDFISSGAITHSFQSLDMSLKAEFEK